MYINMYISLRNQQFPYHKRCIHIDVLSSDCFNQMHKSEIMSLANAD